MAYIQHGHLYTVCVALSKYTNIMKFLKKVGTPNLDSLNVNKRADYSSYITAVDLLTALSDVIDEKLYSLLQTLLTEVERLDLYFGAMNL
jgi:hypothetical protein